MRSEGPSPAVPGSGYGRKGDMQTADEESDHLYQDGGVTHPPRQNAHLPDGDHEHRDSSQSQLAAACHQDPTDASQRSTTDDVMLRRHALDAGQNEYPKPILEFDNYHSYRYSASHRFPSSTGRYRCYRTPDPGGNPGVRTTYEVWGVRGTAAVGSQRSPPARHSSTRVLGVPRSRRTSRKSPLAAVADRAAWDRLRYINCKAQESPPRAFRHRLPIDLARSQASARDDVAEPRWTTMAFAMSSCSIVPVMPFHSLTTTLR
ncbi:hypothetical protein B0H13DRAFT_2402848 [Mycena leptocephala]|nr:hypothetical protein B0H13DRAFT_2402848 [Mycena leptocephala]